MSPLALAIWIMDDGGRMGYGLKLATNCFTYNDCVFLSNTLAELYGIKSSVQGYLTSIIFMCGPNLCLYYEI